MKKIILAILLSSVIVGCKGSDSSDNKGDAGISAEGNCTYDVISAFSDIRYKSSAYNTLKDRAYLTGVLTACTQLKRLLGDRSCKAQNSKTGGIETVSYYTAKSNCDQAAAL